MTQAKPQEERTEEGRCPAINRAGERCKRYVAAGDSFCSAHDPRRSELRKAAASKAGRAFHPQRESAQIRRRILAMVEEVKRGDIEPQIAYAVAALCNVAIGSLKIDLKIKELDEIDRRLDELENRLRESEGLDPSSAPPGEEVPRSGVRAGA
jgi:hypothetical protein